jgi:ribosomal-protein-alanine N-acetyltransferase
MPIMHAPEPLLETSRLQLRLMRADDVDSLLAIFGDPKVMAAFGVPPFDRAQMTQWVQRNLDHQTAHGYGLFSVILKSTGLLIGDCGLELMDVDGLLVAELGYDFRSDYWNQGYATEAATAVRDYAFQHLRLPRLISLIRVGNLASQRVAEKIGMHCTAKITRYGYPYWHYMVERETAL